MCRKAPRLTPEVTDVPLARAIEIGLQATFVTIVGVAAYLLVAEEATATARWQVAGLTVVALIVTAAVWAVTSRRGVPAGAGGWLFLGWALLDIGLIIEAHRLLQDPTGPLLWLLLLPVVQFAVLLDRRSAMIVFASAMAFPLLLARLDHAPLDAPRQILLVTVAGVAAILVGHLSDELRRLLGAAQDEHQAAARRAQLLGSVIEGARELRGGDEKTVVRNIALATVAMGFRGAAIFDVLADGSVRCSAAAGLPSDWVGRILPPETGIVAEAAATGQVREVTDYPNYERAVPDIVELGFRTVHAVPVGRAGEVEAVLAVALESDRSLTEEEREAVAALAVLGSQALRDRRGLAASEASRRDLEELVKAQRDFLSTASHELRTPLTIIGGVTSLLEARWDALPDHRRRMLVGRAARHTRELVRLVERIQLLDELRRGSRRSQPSIVELAPVIADVVHAVAAQAPGRLLTRRCPTDAAVVCDRELLVMVLSEVIDNATRHGPEGTHAHVDVSLHERMWTISVADDGPGIPPGDVQKVTREFHRVGDVLTRSTRGIGIGLALARTAVEHEGGSLVVTSTDRGALISISLPASAAIGGHRDVGTDGATEQGMPRDVR